MYGSMFYISPCAGARSSVGDFPRWGYVWAMSYLSSLLMISFTKALHEYYLEICLRVLTSLFLVPEWLVWQFRTSSPSTRPILTKSRSLHATCQKMRFPRDGRVHGQVPIGPKCPWAVRMSVLRNGRQWHCEWLLFKQVLYRFKFTSTSNKFWDMIPAALVKVHNGFDLDSIRIWASSGGHRHFHREYFLLKTMLSLTLGIKISQEMWVFESCMRQALSSSPVSGSCSSRNSCRI